MTKVIALVAVWAALAPVSYGALKTKEGRPSRSDACGECHVDIYRMWRSSAHAQSMEDPVFLSAFRETESQQGKEVSRICLSCHAPAARMINDAKLDEKITWEGVSCDICHGISAVDLSGATPVASYAPGEIKRGPIRDAASMAHKVEYSDLHTTARVCAPCHEFKNKAGVSIMSTYSEWAGSTAAKEGKNCQDCHMSRTQAEVVDPRVARVPNAEVNLHEVPGGHSLTQLNKALLVAVRPSRASGKLLLEIGLKNAGAGHSVPTGMPGRRIVMDLGIKTSKGRSYEEQTIYGETFADSSGATVNRDCGYFAPGVKRVSDTRIASGETRTENFSFEIEDDATAYVDLRLSYEHSPTGTKENRTWITFYTAQRTVPPSAPARGEGGS